MGSEINKGLPISGIHRWRTNYNITISIAIDIARRSNGKPKIVSVTPSHSSPVRDNAGALRRAVIYPDSSLSFMIVMTIERVAMRANDDVTIAVGVDVTRCANSMTIECVSF